MRLVMGSLLQELRCKKPSHNTKSKPSQHKIITNQNHRITTLPQKANSLYSSQHSQIQHTFTTTQLFVVSTSAYMQTTHNTTYNQSNPHHQNPLPPQPIPYSKSRSYKFYDPRYRIKQHPFYDRAVITHH